MTPQQILHNCGLRPETIQKYVVKVEPPLPKYLITNKSKLENLAEGKTTNGAVRKATSKYYARRKALESPHSNTTPAQSPVG